MFLRESGRNKVVAGVIGLIIVLSALGGLAGCGPVTTANLGLVNPDISKCQQCHEMQPQIATWQVSSHSQIGCENCHRNLDFAAMEAKSGEISKPIRLSGKIAEAVCTQCHSPNRLYSVSGDLIVPHELHSRRGIGCTSCHEGVVHANLAERSVLSRVGFDDYAAWSPELAGKVATRDFVRPSMWVCLDCHHRAELNTPCAACHTIYTSLPSHERDDWGVIHGVEGRRNVDGCSMCHANKEGAVMIDSKTGDGIIDFAQATSYCYACHSKRPADHDAGWMPKHASLAWERGLNNCFACHSIAAPTMEQKVTITYCNRCHWFPANNVRIPEPETKNGEE